MLFLVATGEADLRIVIGPLSAMISEFLCMQTMWYECGASSVHWRVLVRLLLAEGVIAIKLMSSGLGLRVDRPEPITLLVTVSDIHTLPVEVLLHTLQLPLLRHLHIACQLRPPIVISKGLGFKFAAD